MRRTTAAIAIAVAVGVFVDGGFGSGSRGAFAALAGVAILVAVAGDPGAVLRAARTPPVICLAVLAALTAASALWTVGEPMRALRWSLVIAGYGALACAASALGERRNGARAVAAVIALTALGCGLAGLAGVAFRDSPYALHLGGEWQAAGPFEYPPALATIEIAALPILALAALRAPGWRAGAAVAGLAVAVMAIELSSSRLGIVLAGAVVALTIVAWRPAFGHGRAEVAGLWLVGAALPIGALLLADPGDPATPLGGLGRAAVLAAAALLAAVLWPAVRVRIRSRMSSPPAAWLPERGGRRLLAGLGVAAITGTIALGVLLATEREGNGIEPASGILHGRAEQWKAAIEIYQQHPVLGSGGESYFLAAKNVEDHDPVLFAHDLPLELTAELGLAGAGTALALYVGVSVCLWRRRGDIRIWLFGSAAATFMLANLVDWSWHLAGAGAIWALGVGGLLSRPPD